MILFLSLYHSFISVIDKSGMLCLARLVQGTKYCQNLYTSFASGMAKNKKMHYFKIYICLALKTFRQDNRMSGLFVCALNYNHISQQN